MKNDAEQALEIDSARKKGLGYRTKEWARTITDRGYDNVMVMLLPAQLFFTRGKLAWAFWRSSKAAKSSARSSVISQQWYRRQVHQRQKEKHRALDEKANYAQLHIQ